MGEELTDEMRERCIRKAEDEDEERIEGEDTRLRKRNLKNLSCLFCLKMIFVRTNFLGGQSL